MTYEAEINNCLISINLNCNKNAIQIEKMQSAQHPCREIAYFTRFTFTARIVGVCLFRSKTKTQLTTLWFKTAFNKKVKDAQAFVKICIL